MRRGIVIRDDVRMLLCLVDAPLLGAVDYGKYTTRALMQWHVHVGVVQPVTIVVRLTCSVVYVLAHLVCVSGGEHLYLLLLFSPIHGVALLANNRRVRQRRIHTYFLP